MHCRHYIDLPLTRREMLQRCAHGFGAVALSALLADRGLAAPAPLLPKLPHYAPKARNVIFLYMDGGPSQVDTFDHKPMLAKYHGQDPRRAIGKLEPTQFNNIGTVMQSPWQFRQYGDSGIWVSDLFPHIAQHVDRLCVIKSMVSKFPEHTFANYFLHTGSGLQGRPSMGAWVGYGLGSENQNLPGFVVLNGGLIPPGGLDNFGNGFLPAAYQASVFNPGPEPIPNIKPTETSDRHQRNKLALLHDLDRAALREIGPAEKLESAIANYETAYRMQMAVPELTDLSAETESTKRIYGFDHSWKQTQIFARQCLLARRLVERGVRFIELTCPGGNGDRWDQHSNLKEGHENNCRTVDQPIAGLLTDLRQRGLLDSTLVVWAGEFGRTPFAQGANGRDHNPFGFSIWLAGGGVKGGITYGATDDWGYKAVQNKVEIHDLHATMLHLLGLDHTKSTFRFSSRDMRLTDVHGHVIQEILA
ncbi:MAG: DUF1501 domain-containing protein [Gemmataceae bacterium]